MKKNYSLLFLLLPLFMFSQTTDLLISKYGEGTSNNKFIVHQKENIAQQNALYEELVSFITSIHSEKQTLVDASAGREAIKLALLIQEKINESK